MRHDELIKLLAKVSGVELHQETDGDRHVVSIKFDAEADAIAAWDAISDLEGEENDDWPD